MDPLGHLAPWLYKDYIGKEDVEIRPTIAITKAHMKLPELEQSMKEGRLKVDGKICLNESGELAVTKFAVEPVWYLPGVAERFGIGMSSYVHFYGFYFSILHFPQRLSQFPLYRNWLGLAAVRLINLNPPTTSRVAAYSPSHANVHGKMRALYVVRCLRTPEVHTQNSLLVVT